MSGVTSGGSGRAIDAAIFDLDGLLIDSEPLWWAAEIEVFAAVGLHLGEAECAATTGVRIDEVVALRHAEHPWPASAGTMAEVADRIIEALIARVRREGRAMPGAVAAVEAAHARGLRVGLASSSAQRIIVAAIDRLGLAGRFDVLCSAEALPRGKPHPEVYLRTAALLGAPAARCLAIEDSITGLVAAKAARMRCLAVPDGPHHGDPRYALADRTLPSLEALDPATWEILLR